MAGQCQEGDNHDMLTAKPLAQAIMQEVTMPLKTEVLFSSLQGLRHPEDESAQLSAWKISLGQPHPHWHGTDASWALLCRLNRCQGFRFRQCSRPSSPWPQQTRGRRTGLGWTCAPCCQASGSACPSLCCLCSAAWPQKTAASAPASRCTNF